jgi:hypothetical protein
MLHLSKTYRSIALLIAALSAAAGLTHAAVLTVDNNPASVAMYTTLQAAVDAAATGDTILIAGSANSYSANVGRQLHFRGPGYFLTDHNTPGINKNTASVGITLYREGLLNASGCTFSGLVLGVAAANLTASITGISCDKCSIASLSDTRLPGLVVTRSWCGSVQLQNGSSIRNSVMREVSHLFDGSTVSNCVVRDFNSIPSANNIQAGAAISNTIFITSTAVTLSKATFAANVKGSVTHCLAVSGPGPSGGASYLPDGLGNISTILLFADVFTGGVQDKAYFLTPASAAKGAGFGGVDMGVFAGPSPYVIGGLQHRPRITRFVVPATATSASGLRIEMDAEAF